MASFWKFDMTSPKFVECLKSTSTYKNVQITLLEDYKPISLLHVGDSV